MSLHIIELIWNNGQLILVWKRGDWPTLSVYSKVDWDQQSRKWTDVSLYLVAAQKRSCARGVPLPISIARWVKICLQWVVLENDRNVVEDLDITEFEWAEILDIPAVARLFGRDQQKGIREPRPRSWRRQSWRDNISYASRGIAVQEACRIAFIDLAEHVDVIARRKFLEHWFTFVCGCRRCVEEVQAVSPDSKYNRGPRCRTTHVTWTDFLIQSNQLEMVMHIFYIIAQDIELAVHKYNCDMHAHVRSRFQPRPNSI
jgi:hypothetical protein